MSRALPAVLLLAFATPASADPDYSPAYATCMEASDGVTANMIDCIATEHAAQDTRLNANYKALGATLTPERKRQLLAAQRAWIAFRDANCSFYADPDGGTLARTLGNECVLRETTRRADELAELATPGP